MRWIDPRCGHDGEPIIGAFVICRKPGCGKPSRCKRCGSDKLKPFICLGVPEDALVCPSGHISVDPIEADDGA